MGVGRAWQLNLRHFLRVAHALRAISSAGSVIEQESKQSGGRRPACMDDVACLLQAPLPDALLEKLATVAFGTGDVAEQVERQDGGCTGVG